MIIETHGHGGTYRHRKWWPCVRSHPRHTHINTHAHPLEMGRVYRRGLTKTQRCLPDTLRYGLTQVCVHSCASSHRLKDRWMDRHAFIRRNAVGSPGCVCRHACLPTFPATQPHEQQNFTYPCLCAAAHTILPGKGLWAGASLMPPPQLSPWVTVATLLSP